MSIDILIKRGTRAQLDTAAAAGLLKVGEPYLITDEGRLAVGTGTHAYVAMARQGEGGGSGPDIRAYAQQPRAEFDLWIADADHQTLLLDWLRSPTGFDQAAAQDAAIVANLSGNVTAANLLIQAQRALRLLSASALWAQWTGSAVMTATSVPAMTGAVTPSGRVTASSQNGAYHPHQAFDQGVNIWIPDVAQAGEWLAYQFPQPVYVHTVELTPGGLGGPTAWHIQHSDDGASWTTVLEVPAYTPQTGVLSTHPVVAAGRHAHWRLLMQGADGFGSIDELQFKGFL